MTSDNKNNQKGFTIIELMIATVVFSFVLLIASSAVVAIGRLYHKGITSSKTQDVTRSIMEDVSRSIQFSSGDVQSGPGVYCFGEDRYSYVINSKVDLDNPNSRAVVHDTRTNLNQCNPLPLNSGGEELLASNMRLLDFSVVSGGNKSSIVVKVAYGDNDLLTIYDDDAGPSDAPNVPANQIKTAQCKGGIGSDFCSTSQLATVVSKRLE